MYTFFLYSAVCSPFSVRYGAVEMTAIAIIIMIIIIITVVCLAAHVAVARGLAATAAAAVRRRGGPDLHRGLLLQPPGQWALPAATMRVQGPVQ